MIDRSLLDDIVSQLLDAGDDHDTVNAIHATLVATRPSIGNTVFSVAADRVEVIARFNERDLVDWAPHAPAWPDPMGTIVEVTACGPDAMTALVNPIGDGPFLRIALDELTVVEPALALSGGAR